MKSSGRVRGREEEVPTTKMSEAKRQQVLALVQQREVPSEPLPATPLTPIVELDDCHLEDEEDEDPALRPTTRPPSQLNPVRGSMPSFVNVPISHRRSRHASVPSFRRSLPHPLLAIATHRLTKIACVLLACSMVGLAIAAASGAVPVPRLTIPM